MKTKLLTPSAKLPTRATPQSAGLDLYSDHYASIDPSKRRTICTGIAIELPPGTVGYIQPRSGLAARYGIQVLGGVIDADYRDEIRVILLNSGEHTFLIEPGDRIAQLVVQPVCMVEPAVVHELGGSGRQGGFGSTGR